MRKELPPLAGRTIEYKDFPDIRNQRVSVDFEATGLSWREDRIYGVALSMDGFDAYWDVRDSNVMAFLSDQLPHVYEWSNHNLSYDWHMALSEGIDVTRMTGKQLWCTMTSMAVLDETRLHYDLDSVSKDYLGRPKYGDIYQELADMFGGKATRKAQILNLSRAPVDMAYRYAVVDSRNAYDLRNVHKGLLIDEDLIKLWEEIERPLFPKIRKSERFGIPVDTELAERKVDEIATLMVRLQKELDDAAGFPVNPNPSQSIHTLFRPRRGNDNKWRAEDGTVLETTGAGKPSIDKSALERMRDPRAKQVLRLRELDKMKGTFLSGHVLGNAVPHPDGSWRVHPKINQTKNQDGAGIGTGRVSYSEPAMQQIPSRDDVAASMIRPVFVPPPGQKWGYGDMSGHEARIFAHYGNSPQVINQFNADPYSDLHGIVGEIMEIPRTAKDASKLRDVLVKEFDNGKPNRPISKLEDRVYNHFNPLVNAKTMNLAMIFSFGKGTLAESLGLPTETKSFIDKKTEKKIVYLAPGEEAQAVIDLYNQAVPGVEAITKKAKNLAAQRGWIKTVLGRKIHLKAHEARKAAGLVYQGSGGDMTKLGWLMVDDLLEEVGGNFLISIHDEFNFSMPDDIDHKKFLNRMKEAVQDRPYFRLPFIIDFCVPQDNWYAATKAPDITDHFWNKPTGAISGKYWTNSKDYWS